MPANWMHALLLLVVGVVLVLVAGAVPGILGSLCYVVGMIFGVVGLVALVISLIRGSVGGPPPRV